MKINHQTTFNNHIKRHALIQNKNDVSKDVANKLDAMFYEACRRNKIKKMKDLIRLGADIHFENESALLLACSSNNLLLVNWLLDKGANIKRVVSDVLMTIYENKSYELLDVLTKNRVKFTPENCADVLKLACYQKNQRFLKYFFELLSNNNFPLNDLVYWAALSDNLKNLREVFKRGALASNVDEKTLQSVFISSSLKNKIAILKYFLDKGVNIRFDQNTWLWFACGWDIKLLKFLISCGFETKSSRHDLVERASQCNNAECAKYLIFKLGLKLNKAAFRNFLEAKNISFLKFLIKSKKNKRMLGEIAFNVLTGEDYINHITEEKCRYTKLVDKNVCIELLMLLLRKDYNYKKHTDSLLKSIIFLGKSHHIRKLIEKFKFTKPNILNSALCYASSSGNIQFAKYFIKKGANINYCDDLPLRKACQFFKIDMIQFLIDNGANPKFPDLRAYLNLARMQYRIVIKLLLENGANIKECSGEILEQACIKGDFNSAKYLISHGAVDITDEYAGVIIEAACRGGNLNILKYILSKKNINTDPHIPQSIIYASQYNKFKIINFLITYLKSHEYDLLYTVFFACYQSSIHLIEILLEYGISMEKIESAAFRYCMQVGNFTFIDKLISYGFDIHFDNDYLFQDSCVYGDINRLKFLLTKGLNIHRDSEGPLRFACDIGLFNVVKFLHQEGADLHINNNEPLKLACLAREYYPEPYIDEEIASTQMNEHLNIVKYLVNNGANIHEGNESALMAACCSKSAQLDIVQYLISKGANINAVKNKILSILESNGNQEVYDYILSFTESSNFH